MPIGRRRPTSAALFALETFEEVVRTRVRRFRNADAGIPQSAAAAGPGDPGDSDRPGASVRGCSPAPPHGSRRPFPSAAASGGPRTMTITEAAMRNERWVHRFPFTWNDTPFFDPLDAVYEPGPDHFLAELDGAVRERFVRRGVRWVHASGRELPEQGWKIHVSPGPRDVRGVAATVIRHLTQNSFDFEIALDARVFAMLNSRSASRSADSELATVHPHDEERFRTCLSDLSRLLEGAEGAPAAADQRYRDSTVLSFRYGRFRGAHGVDVLGRPLLRIDGPDGPAPDDRHAGQARPDWVAWPFDDWKPGDEDEGDGLLAGRFRVTGAIRCSRSGGVYTAEDTDDGDRPVLIKEARPHTGLDPLRGHDAVAALDREWMVLNLLAAVGSFPAPVARFRHGERHYVAEEFVDRPGIDRALRVHPALAGAGTAAERSREHLRIFLAVFAGLARAVRAAHDRGVVLTGLTPATCSSTRTPWRSPSSAWRPAGWSTARRAGRGRTRGRTTAGPSRRRWPT
ncbi:hypothetical protein SF23_09970 [Streptomyces sp. MBRL 10]|nr:hypothetical protein SF23_09970 [Streptomyces sp. MBRL 10]